MPFRSYTIVISNPSGIPRIATQSKDSVTSRVLSLCLRSFTSWMASRLVLDTLKKMFRSWTDYCPSKLPNECGCFLKASGMSFAPSPSHHHFGAMVCYDLPSPNGPQRLAGALHSPSGSRWHVAERQSGCGSDAVAPCRCAPAAGSTSTTGTVHRPWA